MRFLNVITYSFIGIAGVLAAAILVLQMFGYQPYAVLSGSMEPEYPVGSMIYVQKTDPADLHVGEAITFNRNNTVVTHQIYEIDAPEQTIRTQGIANLDSDGSIMPDAESIAFSQVIGVPVACIPFLGYVNVFCTTMPGILIVAVFAVVLIAASVIAGARKRKRNV